MNSVTNTWARRATLAAGLSLACGWLAAGELQETPSLAALVKSGSLPPVEERLPVQASLVPLGNKAGRHGGSLRMLIGKAKDTRLMTVYGYARLVGYNLKYELEADLLESYEVSEGRIFTLNLREGHRWSDGTPFTAEDFRYYWEDVASNEELSPFGPPSRLLVDGEVPTFEVLSDTAVRFTWRQPNPFFLTALAGARPETIYAPAHYMRQFHPKYTDPAKLAKMAADAGAKDWVSMHLRKRRPYKQTNPDLPMLQPWVLRTKPPSDRFVFERNPYYHRVDDHGQQLPYIDKVLLTVAAAKLIPAKAGAGESDLQSRSIRFADYTFLKRAEKKGGHKVRLWRTTKGAHIALFPNLNVRDAGWRELLRDKRFRHALSLAIDRDEINQVLYTGLAVPGNDTVSSSSPLYRDEYAQAWAQFDLRAANKLLDEMGLDARDHNGVRTMADGRPLVIIVETAGENSEQSDVLELVRESWAKAGIKLLTKPLQREVLKNRVFAGQTLMTVWSGLENGLATPAMNPAELAPTSQQQFQWPMWGQFYETRGKVGEAPELDGVKALLAQHKRWLRASDDETREAAWRAMLQIRAEQTYSIGIVSGVLQPVLVSKRLRGVPKKGIYNWNPGAQFGIYRPDTFWFK